MLRLRQSCYYSLESRIDIDIAITMRVVDAGGQVDKGNARNQRL